MSKIKNQEKALTALILTNTVREAAKDCGLSETTMFRYLKDPDFLAEFRERSKALYNASTARIAHATERAVYVLRRNLDCKQPSVETRSAQILLDSATKRIETEEILRRLEVLENGLEQKDQ
jgi:hypothetical protein